MKKHTHEWVKTKGLTTGKVTRYCLICEEEKDRLQKIIDSKIHFTHLIKMP